MFERHQLVPHPLSMTSQQASTMQSHNKPFYFIRHGETDWNKEGLYQGHNDIPLNQTGRTQAIELSRKMSALKDIDAIFVSPLLRAKETLEIIQKSLPDVQAIELKELMECQSAEAAQYILKHKGITQLPSFERLPQSPEGPEEFISRVKSALRIVLNSQSKRPLIVAHGGVGTAICMILNTPIIPTPNCCLLKYEKLCGRYNVSVKD